MLRKAAFSLLAAALLQGGALAAAAGERARERQQTEELAFAVSGTIDNFAPSRFPGGVLKGALDLGVKWLTVYAFSTENWRRPADEVRFLMGFNESLLVRRRDELNDMGVRMRFIGRRDWRVPKRLIRRMDESVELTKKNRTLTFTIAFNYGGRAEIVDAVKMLVAEGVPADKIDEKAIAKRLYDPEMPDPDLVVRTSGEFRTSNFLMWEAAYSELVFTDTLWPDFRRENLFEAVREYQARDRRFGGLSPEA